MSAYWPRVVGRLVTLLPGLPGWSGVVVSDGPPADGGAPYEYATVGYAADEDGAGSYTQGRGVGCLLEEVGEVRCEVVVVTDRALPSVRARAFQLVDALEAEIASDQTLGVLPVSSTCSLTVDVVSTQTTGGAAQRLIVSVNYFSRS